MKEQGSSFTYKFSSKTEGIAFIELQRKLAEKNRLEEEQRLAKERRENEKEEEEDEQQLPSIYELLNSPVF